MRLQILRENKNLTQEKLAEMLNVSGDAVSTWECGKRYPSRKNGIKLVRYFNAPSLEWLFEVAADDSLTA